MRKIVFILLIILPFMGYAQSEQSPIIRTQISLGTNIISLLNLATINGEVGVAINPKWSLTAQGKFNPFTFNKNDKQFQSRQASVSLGARYWMWHINSGWYVGSSLQMTTYNWGGIISPTTYEGKLHGININAGYDFMLSKNLNLEIGIGALIANNEYTKYSCPKCGEISEQNRKIVILPNNILAQLSIIL